MKFHFVLKMGCRRSWSIDPIEIVRLHIDRKICESNEDDVTKSKKNCPETGQMRSIILAGLSSEFNPSKALRTNGVKTLLLDETRFDCNEADD